ncbi:MAG: glycosyltransferase family 2 protein [Fibromonadaceae bacterium]|jgi:GT2 family glycosyltransferase|nr:glycosyltransferase family 2 protein [Fibromonadaceae bacterium]
MPLISIIILNYNGKKHLQTCFESIFSQNFSDFEVILVDNNSIDDSIQFIEKNYPQIVIVRNEKNLGFAGGNNVGIARAKGEWIFLLNNDTALAPDCLAEIAKNIADGKQKQLVFAPLMLRFDDPEKIDSGGDCLYPWCYGYKYEDKSADDSLFAETRKISLACGGAVVFSKELLNKLGGFDEDFFLIYEDVDLSLRAKRIGAEIWMLPKAKVLHKGYATITSASALRMYYSERNRFWLKIKHYPLWTLLKYTPHFFVCLFSSLLLWTYRGAFLTWLKAYINALLGISKMLKKRRKIFSESKVSTADFESWLLKESFFKWLKSLVSPSINIKR